MEPAAAPHRPIYVTMRLAIVVVIVLAGCSGSHHSASSSTTTTSTTILPKECHGCGAATQPSTMCRHHIDGSVVEVSGTSVSQVRSAGIGVAGAVFKSAFPKARASDPAAWCMVRARANCYDEWAVAITGERVHIADAGCGWPKGPPPPGPPVWTD